MPTNRNPALRTLATDYRKTAFENENLLLFDVLRARFETGGEMVVRDVSFTNCHIEGPAVLLPVIGCNFEDCNFGIAHGDMRTLILHPAAPDKVTGAIPMIGCTFTSVDFFSIGFTGAKAFLDEMMLVETLQVNR